MRIQKHSNYKPKFRKERKEYEIEVCYKCNWDCEYCCVETHTKQPKTDKEIFDNFYSLGIKDANITISGGEPSYASDYLLIALIEYALMNRCDLNLNTNGRFFKKKPELLKYFKEINYHCSIDLEIIDIKNYDHLVEGTDTKINYLVVVTDNNFGKLPFFIDYNQMFFMTHKLLAIPASNPYGVNRPILSQENYKSILRNQRILSVLSKESKLRFITSNKSFIESEIEYIPNFTLEPIPNFTLEDK